MSTGSTANRKDLHEHRALFSGGDFKVADLDAQTVFFGRKEIDLAEFEMPGLIATRENTDTQSNATRITGSLHMTIQTAVLIETLVDLGTEVRWASCNISRRKTMQLQRVKGRESAAGVPVYAWKGETLEVLVVYTQALDWGDDVSPTLIVDDGGDATLLIHLGYEYEVKGERPDPSTASNDEERVILQILADVQDVKGLNYWHQFAKTVRGVSEETTTGVHRLYQRMEDNSLLFPAINVNDSVTKSKFDNVYGCRHSLVDAVMRATDVMLSGKRALVCGFGDVGKGSVQALQGQQTRVAVTEVDPIVRFKHACGTRVTDIDALTRQIFL